MIRKLRKSNLMDLWMKSDHVGYLSTASHYWSIDHDGWLLYMECLLLRLGPGRSYRMPQLEPSLLRDTHRRCPQSIPGLCANSGFFFSICTEDIMYGWDCQNLLKIKVSPNYLVDLTLVINYIHINGGQIWGNVLVEFLGLVAPQCNAQCMEFGHWLEIPSEMCT